MEAASLNEPVGMRDEPYNRGGGGPAVSTRSTPSRLVGGVSLVAAAGARRLPR